MAGRENLVGFVQNIFFQSTNVKVWEYFPYNPTQVSQAMVNNWREREKNDASR